MERVSDFIIGKLKNNGIKHIFLITGRGILYLTDAVAKEDGITPVSTFHEQGASYAAMAYAASTGGMAACLVSTGCASTNAVTAALCAYQDNLPIVFISGNNPLAENTRHTGVPIRTYGSQEADIISIVSSITKYSVMLNNPNDVAYEVEKAVYFANEGRKGPVWIDVPLDVQNMRVDAENLRHFYPNADANNKQVSAKEVETVNEELSKAQRPILLIGGGTKGCNEEVSILAEKYHYPIVFSPAAATVYGSAHEMSIGAVGSLGGTRAGNFAVQNSDYILAIGTKLCTQQTGMHDKFARDAKVVVVDIDEKEHTKSGVKLDRIIISDSKVFLKALIDETPPAVSADWVDKCKHWKSFFSISNEPFIKDLESNNELDIYSVANALSGVLPKDATIITDAGFEELIIPSSVDYTDGQICLFPAAQGAMGYAIPAIIGAHFAGRKNILCVVGDGSFMMNMQELQLIKASGIPAKIMVISNNMYAVIRKRQRDLFKNRTIGNDPSDGVSQPDFRKIAGCFELKYRLISNREEFDRYIKDFSFDSSAELIEVICTPDQKYLHESYGLTEKRKLVHRPIEDMAPFLDRDIIRKEMIIDMVEE